ncbi:aquaporin, partial [bacterium LRH843]|nr:aquaporin [bacterium LRH843]
METTTETRTVVSEFLGTLLLVFFAVGSAVLAGEYIGTFGIALAFGFTLLALAYAIGPISGSHVNPAVTLGMLLAHRIT